MMENLQIFNLEIKNYRQYKDTVSIDLKTEDQRHINVIQGENGTGKSNLLNAITLCLFGKEQHQENNVEADAVLPYANLDKLENTEEGEAVDGYVEIEMGTDHPKFIFKRKFRTFNVDGSYSDVLDDIEAMRMVEKDWKTEENPVTTLNEILPERVSQYFIFDGEQLQRFFDQRYQKRVKGGILDVSHIELLDRALDHLNRVRYDLQSKAGDYEGRPKEIRDEINEIDTEISEKEAKIDRFQEDIDEADNQLDIIDAKLQDVTDEEVKRLYDKREMLEGQLEDKNDALESMEKNAEETLLKGGPLVHTHNALKFAEKELERLSEKGQLPPKIRTQFINELLDRGECICGADLDGNHEKAERLMSLEAEITSLGEDNFTGKVEIPRLLEDMEDKAEELREQRAEIGRLEKAIEEIDSDLREIKIQLQDFDIPDEVDIGALENQREELKDERDKLIRNQGRVETEIEDLKSQMTTKERELKEELKKEERFKELSQKLDFIDNVRDDLEGIRETILSKIRTRIEDNINKFFNELIWKEQSYNINLQEDYRIQVLDEHGENLLGSLSAGETQVLALSFMAALSRISGFRAPIVIDTPLGRISGEPKRKIAQNLPNYLEKSQVTFLMTDQEYSSDVRGLMQSHVENEYFLEYHDGQTEVKKLATV